MNMTELKTTRLHGFAGEVIVTEGATLSDGSMVYGVFASADDARSMDSDTLALGTVAASALAASQIADARHNSESLAE